MALLHSDERHVRCSQVRNALMPNLPTAVQIALGVGVCAVAVGGAGMQWAPEAGAVHGALDEAYERAAGALMALHRCPLSGPGMSKHVCGRQAIPAPAIFLAGAVGQHALRPRLTPHCSGDVRCLTSPISGHSARQQQHPVVLNFLSTCMRATARPQALSGARQQIRSPWDHGSRSFFSAGL
ncbi:MAG: hypothetical protein WDW38_004345 [Sanguina aurantia]